MSERKEIILVPEQDEALHGVVESLDTYGVALDISKPGAGKTIQAIAAKRRLEKKYAHTGKKFIMFVIQPATQKESDQPGGNRLGTRNTVDEDSDSLSPWRRECTKYGETDCYHSITYNSLRVSADSKATVSVYTRRGGENATILREIPPGAEFYAVSEEERAKYVRPRSVVDTPDDRYADWSVNALIYGKWVKQANGKYLSNVSPTQKFMQLPGEVTLMIVVDEFHNVKNDSEQARAVACAFRVVMRARAAGTPAFILLLSGTPLQKVEHSVNYMGVMGTHDPVSDDIMFVSSTVPVPEQCYLEARTYDRGLANDIAIKGKLVNPDTQMFMPVSEAVGAAMMMRFWRECIAPKISHFVPSPSYGQAFTLMFNLTREADIKLLNEANALLRKAEEQKEQSKLFPGKTKRAPATARAVYSSGVKRIGEDDATFKLLIEAQGLTEKAMLFSVAQDAISRLRADPKCKIFVCLRRIENVDAFLHMFPSNYNIQRFVGKDMDIRQKEQVKREFQLRDSVRGIVGTIQSMAVGINFQDILGGRQIFSYITNDRDVVLVEQAVKRTDRRDSQSYPVEFVFYPRQLGHTQGIYDSSIEKSKKSREMIDLRRKLVSEETNVERKRDLYNTLSPGEYNRAFQFKEIGIIYLLDHPIFDVQYNEVNEPIGFRYIPSEPGTWGYIGYEDTFENRQSYKVENTEQLIDFLQSVIDSGMRDMHTPVNLVHFRFGVNELHYYLLGHFPSEVPEEELEDISSDAGKTVLSTPGALQQTALRTQQLIKVDKSPVYLRRMLELLPGIRLTSLLPSWMNPAPQLRDPNLQPL